MWLDETHEVVYNAWLLGLQVGFLDAKLNGVTCNWILIMPQPSLWLNFNTYQKGNLYYPMICETFTFLFNILYSYMCFKKVYHF